MARLIDASGVTVFDGTIEDGGGFTGWTQDASDPANVDSNGGDLAVSTLTGNVNGNLNGSLDNGTQKLDGDGLDTGGAAIQSGGGDISSDGGNISTGTMGGNVTTNGGDVKTGAGGKVETDQVTGRDNDLIVADASDRLAFFGGTPANPSELPALPTPQDIADVLVSLNLCSQA